MAILDIKKQAFDVTIGLANTKTVPLHLLQTQKLVIIRIGTVRSIPDPQLLLCFSNGKKEEDTRIKNYIPTTELLLAMTKLLLLRGEYIKLATQNEFKDLTLGFGRNDYIRYVREVSHGSK